MRTDCAGASVIAGRWIGILAVAGLASVVLAVSGPAVAEDPSARTQEVPIGTFTLGPSHDGFSVVEPPDGVPKPKRDGADDGSGRWFFQGWERTPPENRSAESLYQDAMKALDDGRRDEAQRLLERLVAEAPDSPRVGAARIHLGQIYRSIEVGAAAPASVDAPDGAEAPWSGGKDVMANPASLEAARPVSRAVLHQARVSPALDGEFLSDAGDRVFFSAGSADLGTRARGVIQAQARFLLRYPELFAAVEGYADDGALPDDETQRLSERRAIVVRARLIAEGVDEARLVAYGRSRDDRVSDCPAPECLAQNRRAVTILLNRRVDFGAPPSRRAQGDAPAGSTASPTQ